MSVREAYRAVADRAPVGALLFIAASFHNVAAQSPQFVPAYPLYCHIGESNTPGSVTRIQIEETFSSVNYLTHLDPLLPESGVGPLLGEIGLGYLCNIGFKYSDYS